MKKSYTGAFRLFTLLLVMMMVLSACGGGTETAEPAAGAAESGQAAAGGGTAAEDDKSEDGLVSIEDFDTAAANEGTAIEGGSLNYGLVSDTPFEGTLNPLFSSGVPDANVSQFFSESMLTVDENYVYTNDGAATYEVSDDGRVFTFTIRDEVNWSDGKPVTAEDWIFAFEVIGHPEYDGPRYGSDIENIEGMAEYHEGKADTISGLVALSDKKLRMTFLKATPSLLSGGLWTSVVPKHVYGDIPITEMAAAPETREHPIGFGPFVVDRIVPGESVTYKRNDNYWRGKPALDGVTLRVVSPSTVVQQLETGGVDLVDAFPADQYPDNADMSNVQYLGDTDAAYTYIGFKLGTWDKKAKEVVTNPDAKMADVNLRKAMWYAVDNDQVGQRFYHGLRWNATTLIAPSHPDFHDTENPGVAYDPEEAKRLLDEAGYKMDGEFRTNPDGTPLEINFVSMTGSDVAEPLAQYYVQSWKAIGLNVKLEMLEFNTFYDRVGQNGDDDPSVDVFQGAWSLGYDVDPTALYGRDALFNFSRWSNEENDRLLKEGVSEASMDVAHRQQVYKDWQQLMVDEVPVFPTLYRASLVPVNKRVMNYDIATGSGVYLYQLALNSDKPVVAE
ncbi:oligopeptide ABC transporter substrate-binding protein [Saccharibacillus alkalitolerans]|uniref:Oligopeptide ABC transporter substrate-binding protein n=1 Tax=Saccharibacillus alkalitolerans TaxID=2705290 RepID=A0ABX0F419_9BACL|nr:oligopeptide ABC transporter substrate-binding protein [Saccharibacillus alkalitolerans]NGZ75118.1 oligopeptide ABC transporter substrate-binding protein [Saccharibacillus alkalitolerans]